jgi:hypothetical protein
VWFRGLKATYSNLMDIVVWPQDSTIALEQNLAARLICWAGSPKVTFNTVAPHYFAITDIPADPLILVDADGPIVIAPNMYITACDYMNPETCTTAPPDTGPMGPTGPTGATGATGADGPVNMRLAQVLLPALPIGNTDVLIPWTTAIPNTTYTVECTIEGTTMPPGVTTARIKDASRTNNNVTITVRNSLGAPIVAGSGILHLVALWI